MKAQKLVNLGLSIALSLVFISFILSNRLVSLISIGSIIGLMAESYYFFNLIKSLGERE